MALREPGTTGSADDSLASMITRFPKGSGRRLRGACGGVLRALVLRGCLVLRGAIAQAIVAALWQGVRFSDLPAAFVIAFAQDAFCVAVLAGVALALINRFVVKPLRFRGSHRGDAVLILGWIGTPLIFMTLNYATLIAQGNPVQAMAADRPFASAVSRLFTPLAHSNTLIGWGLEPTEPIYALRGVVKTAGGAAATQAVVSLSSQTETAVSVSTTNGTFEFRGLPGGGNWNVYASATGFRSSTAS